MKITAFNGSPRGDKGNTYVIAEEFLAGAKDAGAEVEHILLAGKEIKHCLGCFTCWLRTPGKCAISDDMKDLLPKVMNTDVIVFATPLYVDNVTGLMKNFIVRLLERSELQPTIPGSNSLPLKLPEYGPAYSGA
jgi:multimeric flavodoxin WrbA